MIRIVKIVCSIDIYKLGCDGCHKYPKLFFSQSWFLFGLEQHKHLCANILCVLEFEKRNLNIFDCTKILSVIL